MFVKGFVDECDWSDRKYNPSVEGARGISQGATGRWCCVMFVGPEEIAKNNIKVISYEEAVAECNKIGGSIDF